MEQEDDVLERAGQIMQEAVEKAGELLSTKPQIAEVILKQLLKIDPENHAALQLLGLCKHRLGENEEAIEIIQAALELDPESADDYNNLALAYGALDNYERGIECMKKAIALKPEQFLFKNNLALQYRSIGDYENAIQCMREAVEKGNQPQLWLNLGGMYGEMKDIDESEKCFEKALRIDPDYPAAYVDLAFTYHLKGDWQKGFAAYEWRFWYYPQMQYYLKEYDMSKVWDGKADLNGKRVLIYGEQGMGDIIQFMRYAKELKAKGAHVIINCPLALDALVRRIEGVDETTNRNVVDGSNGEFPKYDYQFSLMSFPYLLEKKEISGEPYIQPVTRAFKDNLHAEYGDVFKIGIVWAGSPAHPHDKRRSIPLKFFRKIHDTEGVKLFSLQMDARKRQYGATYHAGNDDQCGDRFQAEKGVVDYCEGCDDMKLVDLTSMIQSFEDTCTILAGLDLVICCDTATAHLAGAMGVPVWVCIPYNPDWRWSLEGETTHWYDSMRLYRQSEREKWEDVFGRIQEDLHATLLQNQ